MAPALTAAVGLAWMIGLAGADRTADDTGVVRDEVVVPETARNRSPSDEAEPTDRAGGGVSPAGGLVCRPNDCAAWSLDVPDAATVLPVGGLLVTVDRSRVSAHDTSLGEPRWSLDLGTVFARGAVSNPRVADAAGALLLHEQGRIVRLDPRDGDPLWQTDLGTRRVTRVGGADGQIVVTTGDRLPDRSRPTTVIGLDADRGTIRWERRILDVLAAPDPSPSGNVPDTPPATAPDTPPANAPDTAPAMGGHGGPEQAGSRLAAPGGVLAVALDPTTIGGIDVLTGETVWERAAVDGEVTGARVVLRGGNGRALLLDGATGTTLTDLGDTVAGLGAIGPLVVATSTDGRSFVVDAEGAVTDRRSGPPLGWTETPTGVFIAWEDEGWVLLVRYERSGVPSRSRRLPGRIGSWGGELTLGAHAGSDLVRAVGADGRTTVAVRTDGPTEPPPNPSVAPSGTRLRLIGRTVVARDDAGLGVRAPGGSVRVESGREVVTVAPDGTVVVRGDGGLLGIGVDRLGPVVSPERPGLP